MFGSGSLWVANLDDQTVSRIDPASLQALRTLSVADLPTGLAAGTGAIWVAQSNPAANGALVSAIDPVFDEVGPTERVGDVWAGATVESRRKATAFGSRHRGLLSRLDPMTGHVVQQLDPNSGGSAIAVGGGAVWMTDTEANNVTRVDPSGLVNANPGGQRTDRGRGRRGRRVGRGLAR